MSDLLAPISAGDLIDKITILEIKQHQISVPEKLKNINQELELLTSTWQKSSYAQTQISELRALLKSINQKLWDIEDRIRIKEAKKDFDEEFISLARSVYMSNDERARLKREINTAVGSSLMEEKSYAPY